MREMSGLRIAKKILEEMPDQNIIFTSTWDMDPIRSEMLIHSIDPDKYAILHKPFIFSNFLALIKPAKFKINS